MVAPGPPCSTLIATSFMLQPQEPLDLSCLSGIAPVEFEASASIAMLYFGVADPWENGPTVRGVAPRATEVTELRRRLGRIRMGW